MAIRTVVKLGDDILREKSREVVVFDKRLSDFVDDLFDTLKKEQGAGLAAVQVGILKRIAVIDMDGKKYELINPVVLKSEGSVRDYEGCLSIPNRREAVVRPKTLTVRAQDRRGAHHDYTVNDYTARAFCHEMDHMDGVLFIDKVEKR